MTTTRYDREKAAEYVYQPEALEVGRVRDWIDEGGSALGFSVTVHRLAALIREVREEAEPDIDEDTARLHAGAAALLAACEEAARELNEIRARDGVPYTHKGHRASVTEEHFGAVVDRCFAAIEAAKGGAR